MQVNKLSLYFVIPFLLLLSFTSSAELITGMIKNNNNQPLKAATISVVGIDTKVKSNAEGLFSLEIFKRFPVELHVQLSGYHHKNLVVEKAGFQTIVLDKSLIEHVDVIGLPIHASTLESATPVNVVSGEALRDKQASTLGETLKAELGVHSTYFGPVASSPIIRGLDGPRVLITQNSLDVTDASRVGPDHLVASETSTAEQIEILRGPATLFYGSGAIGGVVNVVDNRVPTTLDTRGDWQINHNTVADETEASININTGADKIAYHFDAFTRTSNDYEIPAVAELGAHDEHESEAEHEAHSSGHYKLANSSASAKGFTLGSSYIFDHGYVGFSFGHMDRRYGIPAHGAHEEHEDDAVFAEEEHAEDVKGALKQNRWQVLSEVNLNNDWLINVKTKLGFTHYTHAEIEDGEVGTRFNNDTAQLRVDLGLHEIAGWRGALTFDYKNTDFAAIGEEAFTPSNTTESIAIALIEEKHFGDLLVQTGFRVEHVTIDASSEALGLIEHDESHDNEIEDLTHEEITHFESLDFTPISISAGGVWDFTKGYNLGLSLTYAERAPSAGEVFAFGPHIGTNSFEIGAYYQLHQESPTELHFEVADNLPKKESSKNIDLTLRKFSGDLGFIVSGFYNQIDDFYYQANTGQHFEDDHDHGEASEVTEPTAEEAHDEGLPIFIYQQADAKFYGLEGQIFWQLDDTYKLTVLADTIRGKLTNGENLPRIPPSRLGFISEAEYNHWRAELSLMRYFKQDTLAPLETATDAYTMVDVSAHYYFSVGQQDLTLFFKARNITDEEARVHTSFIKDQTLLPGRGFTLGLRGDF